MRTVCFCNGNIPWGGGEVWHLNAARSLVERSWRVLMLCHPRGELYARAVREPNITVLPLALGRLSFLNPLMRRRLVRLFSDEAVQALIMNLPSDLKAAAPAAKAAGVRHIVYRRGSALPVRDSVLNRYLYGSVITRLIVNSKATRAQALANNAGLIPDDRITVLPNGVDVPTFDAALERAEQTPWPFAANSVPKPFIIGNAGRLNKQKGQHLLLHLARRLKDAELDFRLVIAGAGEREAELKELARRLDVDSHVFFPGFMADLSPFWREIDLFVLTSLWEGFGNVIIEAGLAKKPVFAFSVSNLPELVEEGVNGRLFPLPEEEVAHSPEKGGREPRNTLGQNPYAALDGMARAVLELAENPDEDRRMGLAGRSLALRFSQDVCMDVLERLLD